MKMESNAMVKPRILLCDDLKDPRDLVCTSLTLAGFEVTCTSSGMEAINAVRAAHAAHAPYDAIILDIALQDVDGYSVAQIIRILEAVEPPHPPCPIAFLTAYIRQLSKADLVEKLGIGRVWDKALDVTALPQLLEEWLAESKLEVAYGSA
jgi:CheY-like chemotaxis protein